jgi:hypothetical protein
MLIVRTLPPRATRAQQCRCCERRQRRRGRAFHVVVMCVCCPPRTAGRQGEFPLGGGQGRGNLHREDRHPAQSKACATQGRHREEVLERPLPTAPKMSFRLAPILDSACRQPHVRPRPRRQSPLQAPPMASARPSARPPLTPHGLLRRHRDGQPGQGLPLHGVLRPEHRAAEGRRTSLPAATCWPRAWPDGSPALFLPDGSPALSRPHPSFFARPRRKRTSSARTTSTACATRS